MSTKPVIITTRKPRGPQSPRYTLSEDVDVNEKEEIEVVELVEDVQENGPKNREFIDDKLSNMIVFLRGVRDIYGNDIPEIQELITSINEYKQDYSKFTIMVTRAIKPYENDLETLMNRYLATWNIDSNILKTSDKNKVKRYLYMFCRFAN